MKKAPYNLVTTVKRILLYTSSFKLFLLYSAHQRYISMPILDTNTLTEGHRATGRADKPHVRPASLVLPHTTSSFTLERMLTNCVP